MFGKKRNLRNDLPVFDLRKKPVKGLFGQTKLVATTKKEQRVIKKLLMEQYSDRYYVDDLCEWNSISIVFRYIMTYYNRQRIYTANPNGLPPAMFRQAARGLVA